MIVESSNGEMTAFAKKWWVTANLFIVFWCFGLTLGGFAFLVFAPLGTERGNEMIFPGAFSASIGMAFLLLFAHQLFSRIKRVVFVDSEKCLYLYRFLRATIRLRLDHVRGYSACGYIGRRGQSNGIILYTIDHRHHQLVDDVLTNLNPIVELVRKSGVVYLGEERTPFPIFGRHRFDK
jgi:hypothetical protein